MSDTLTPEALVHPEAAAHAEHTFAEGHGPSGATHPLTTDAAHTPIVPVDLPAVVAVEVPATHVPADPLVVELLQLLDAAATQPNYTHVRDLVGGVLKSAMLMVEDRRAFIEHVQNGAREIVAAAEPLVTSQGPAAFPETLTTVVAAKDGLAIAVAADNELAGVPPQFHPPVTPATIPSPVALAEELGHTGEAATSHAAKFTPAGSHVATQQARPPLEHTPG